MFQVVLHTAVKKILIESYWVHVTALNADWINYFLINSLIPLSCPNRKGKSNVDNSISYSNQRKRKQWATFIRCSCQYNYSYQLEKKEVFANDTSTCDVWLPTFVFLGSSFIVVEYNSFVIHRRKSITFFFQ